MKKFENVYQDAALMKKALLGEANESEQQELGVIFYEQNDKLQDSDAIDFGQ